MSSFNGALTYEGPHAPDQLTVDAALKHASDVRMLKEQAGLPRMTKAFDLLDGAQVYVLDYEHVRRVHIVVPGGPEPSEAPLPVSEYDLDEGVPIAGMLSGAANTGTMDWEEISWPTDTEDQKTYPDPVPIIMNHAFGLTPESAALFPVPQASFKLAVQPYATHSTVGDMTPRTQFQHIIPGRYTGAMASIVQLLLGVGRIVDPDYEARWRKANDAGGLFGEVTKSEDGQVVAAADVQDVDSWYTNVGETVQISYDYRWNRTHGVVWGSTNSGGDAPILAEIAQRGVHVMPLPVDNLSKYDQVQAYYKKVYPTLEQYAPFKGGQQTLFEALDGFPTGGNMPGDNNGLDRWVRAGAVVRAENDMSEFYNGMIGISTGFGWAFHPSKPQAINTGYRYENDHKVGKCYEVILDISEKPESQKQRNPLFNQVVVALALQEPIDIFKARRLTESQAESILFDPDYDAFDAMEVEPDWTVVAKLSLVREGIIDYPFYQCPRPPGHPCDIIGSPHFKYHEPMFNDVFSFYFENEATRDKDYTSDGPIFATYTNRGAEILNYFYKQQTSAREEVNTRQVCQYTGTWTIGHYSEGTRLAGYFYSTSKDFRKQIRAGSGSLTDYGGRRVGHADFLNFCAFFGIHGTMSRHYFGTETWERETWSGQSYHVAVSCAANNRSAFFVCREEAKRERQFSSGFSGRKNIGSSGRIRRGVIYNFVWHWVGCADWSCYGDPSCRFNVCYDEVINPNSCHGTAQPSDINYAVCCDPPDCRGDTSIVSPVVTEDGTQSAIVSAYYTPLPSVPPKWSKGPSDPQWDFEWEVWGMGLDLMNAKKLKSRSETITDPQSVPRRASVTSWWRCSLENCPTPPYHVGQNFYGKPFIVTYDDLDWSNIVQFGAEPEVGFGPRSVPFGVLE